MTDPHAASPPVLQTDRLFLRRFILADAEEVAERCGKRELASGTLNIPHPYSVGDAESWILSQKKTREDGTGVDLAVVNWTGDLVGSMGLIIDPRHGVAEMGYWIGVDFWNRGYATEAGRAVLSYAFGPLGLRRVYAFHFTRNPASGRVLEKIGMSREGVWRKHVMKWGVAEDLVGWGILAEELES